MTEDIKKDLEEELPDSTDAVKSMIEADTIEKNMEEELPDSTDGVEITKTETIEKDVKEELPDSTDAVKSMTGKETNEKDVKEELPDSTDEVKNVTAETENIEEDLKEELPDSTDEVKNVTTETKTVEKDAKEEHPEVKNVTTETENIEENMKEELPDSTDEVKSMTGKETNEKDVKEELPDSTDEVEVMNTEAIEKNLKEKFPDSTEAECFRFVQAATAVHKFANKKLDKEQLIGDTASEKLGEYLEWRSLYGVDFDRPAADADDSTIWDWAVRKALGAEKKKKEEAEIQRENNRWFRWHWKKSDATEEPPKVDYDSKLETALQQKESTGDGDNTQTDTEKIDDSEDIVEIKDESSKRTLPQFIFKRKDPKTGEYVRDKKGSELIHVLASRIDRYAADYETLAMVAAFYIDANADRNSKCTATILVDDRSGEGWPNSIAMKAVPLIGQIVTEIEKRHPERCKSVIICPLPLAMMVVWGAFKGDFSPEVNGMMEAYSGPSGIGSPLPQKLEAHVDDATLEFLDVCRTNLYVSEPKDEDHGKDNEE
uniref:CRAL-TRIO domain-containing protein n=1 Tax=Pseudo-nitzschia australis TaxID=44445 RepID=A0A7S4ACG1_9STRA